MDYFGFGVIVHSSSYLPQSTFSGINSLKKYKQAKDILVKKQVMTPIITSNRH